MHVRVSNPNERSHERKITMAYIQDTPTMPRNTRATKSDKNTPWAKVGAALAADGDAADAVAAAAAAAADDATEPNPTTPTDPKQDQTTNTNPLDLLAGAASEHHDKDDASDDSAAPSPAKPAAKAKAAPEPQPEPEPAKTQNTTRITTGTTTTDAAGATKATNGTTAPALAPAAWCPDLKKKRNLPFPVAPVGAKVADDFKVINCAVTDVPAASSQQFTIRNNDVLSGRGGGTNHHPGNILFRNLVKAKQKDYVRATRHEKSYIARDIVSIMRKLDPPARFLKKDPKNPDKWIEIGDKNAREKTSQALREGAPMVRSKLDTNELPLQQRAMAVVKGIPPAGAVGALPVPVPASVPGAAAAAPASVPVPATTATTVTPPSSRSPATNAAAAAGAAVPAPAGTATPEASAGVGGSKKRAPPPSSSEGEPKMAKV